MKIEEFKGYGVAMSDFEGGWDPEFKAKIKKVSKKIVFGHLAPMQKIRMFYWFIKELNRSKRIDLSDLRARGMKNQAFLDQQLEYLAMFSAVKKVVGVESALSIMCEVMDATAAEALLHPKLLC